MEVVEQHRGLLGPRVARDEWEPRLGVRVIHEGEPRMAQPVHNGSSSGL